MKKIVLLLTLSLSFCAYAKLCDITSLSPELEAIADSTFAAERLCLKSMGLDPASPPNSKLPFQKMEGREVMAINCNLNEEDDELYERFLFITDEGMKSLRFPKYKYPVGGDTAELPRNVTHFKDGIIDYYITPSLVGQPTIHTSDKLPAISDKMGYSINKIKSEYIKKYEDYLKSKGLISSISLSLTSADETKVLLPCLEQRKMSLLKDYLSMKFIGRIPGYNTIVGHYNQFTNLPAEQKKIYAQSWDDFKQEMLSTLRKDHALCNGIVEDKDFDSFFDDYYGDSKKLYESMHERHYGQSQP